MIQAESFADIFSRYPRHKREHLIPILQDVQEAVGYLSKEAVLEIGRHTSLPSSKIYGVATFYNQFRFQPRGRCHFMVCRGTACHVKGSSKVLDLAMQLLRLKPGQTSRDKQFSLETVACMGACGLAPVVNLSGEFHAKLTPQRLAKLISEARPQETTDVCN